ncbi:MAG: hypothetical protein GY928_02150 [Colwellia sp.]|nr:hypothetical protein [Colwellia sp.]
MKSVKEIKQDIENCDKAINTIKVKGIESALEVREYKIRKDALLWVLNKY